MTTSEEEMIQLRKELKELQQKESDLMKKRRGIDNEINANYAMIKLLYKKLPRCCSCGRNGFMKIATQADVDEYVDQREGYSGPDVGEYYCGC